MLVRIFYFAPEALRVRRLRSFMLCVSDPLFAKKYRQTEPAGIKTPKPVDFGERVSVGFNNCQTGTSDSY